MINMASLICMKVLIDSQFARYAIDVWHQFQERSWVQYVEIDSCKKQGKTTYNKPIVVQPFPQREFNVPNCLLLDLVLLSTLFEMLCLLWLKCLVF